MLPDQDLVVTGFIEFLEENKVRGAVHSVLTACQSVIVQPPAPVILEKMKWWRALELPLAGISSQWVTSAGGGFRWHRPFAGRAVGADHRAVIIVIDGPGSCGVWSLAVQ